MQHNFEDYRRDGHKPKRSKSDHIQHLLSNYLDKRNYSYFPASSISPTDFLDVTTVKNDVSRSNSILFRCYNFDPLVIDKNFSQFLMWLKEMGIRRYWCDDLESLVAPLFCHLYLEIVSGGNYLEATKFYKVHCDLIDEINYDPFIKDLFDTFPIKDESKENYFRNKFRSEKFTLQLAPETRELLINFVAQNCHVVFLHVLQTWFEFKELHPYVGTDDRNYITDVFCFSPSIDDLFRAADDLELEPQTNTLSMTLKNCILDVNCGAVCREIGMLAYNQGSNVIIRAINNCDNAIPGSYFKEVLLNGHCEKVYTIDFTPTYVASGAADGSVCLYHTQTFELVRECSGHIGPVFCVKVSQNELYLASGGQDKSVRLWGTQSGNLLKVFIGHADPVFCVGFHPNCLYMFSGGADCMIRMWDMEDAIPVRLFTEAKRTMLSLEMHPYGEYLAGVSDDNIMRIWNVVSAKEIASIKCADTPVIKLKWSYDGQFLFGASIDSFLRVFCCRCLIDKNYKEVKLHTAMRGHGYLVNVDYAAGAFGCLSAIPSTND